MRLLLCACIGVSTVSAFAQDAYPTRPIRLIVPSSPGGGTDTTARIIAPKLGERLGQQVVVENRPGASTMIGIEAVARAAPDGHTLLIGNSTMTILPALKAKLSVDPVKDLAAIGKVVETGQMLVTHPALPARNLKELIALAKARPGQLDYAAGAPGGNGHLSMELLLSMAAIRVTYIPYKSGNAGLVDTLSGQVPIMMGSILSVLPHVKSGRLRAHGVTSEKRASGAPDIPTLAEAGVPGYAASQWFGLFAPAAAPRTVLVKVHDALKRTLGESDVRKRLIDDGAEPAASATPEEFAAFVRAEVAKWGKVVKSAGIRDT